MNILVLGAGAVGKSLVLHLTNENNDITVVDVDPVALQQLQDVCDIKAVNGSASQPEVLEQAGADFADMLIAATQNDEVNIIACQICYSLFKTPTKIARIRSIDCLNYPKLFDKNSDRRLAVDFYLTPEHSITNYIYHLIQHPGALQVEDFADGRVRLIVLNIKDGRIMHDKTIAELHELMPCNNMMRIVVIYRHGKAIFPDGSTKMQVGDEVFLLAETNDIQTILKTLGRLDNPYENIFIAGGGYIGMDLASMLDKNYRVKIIDSNFTRTRMLAETLDNSIVLNGDITDESIMIEEDMDEIDLFVAVTNTDECNAISATMAKHFGAKKAIALLNKPVYAEILHNANIDIAFSATHITASEILRYVREGDTVQVHSLRRGTAEVMEIILHGSQNSSPFIGKPLQTIKWPVNTCVGCIVRDEQIIFHNPDLELEAEDHLVIFAGDRSKAREVAHMFA